jgi:hypothetical protein
VKFPNAVYVDIIWAINREHRITAQNFYNLFGLLLVYCLSYLGVLVPMMKAYWIAASKYSELGFAAKLLRILNIGK